MSSGHAIFFDVCFCAPVRHLQDTCVDNVTYCVAHWRSYSPLLLSKFPIITVDIRLVAMLRFACPKYLSRLVFISWIIYHRNNQLHPLDYVCVYFVSFLASMAISLTPLHSNFVKSFLSLLSKK